MNQKEKTHCKVVWKNGILNRFNLESHIDRDNNYKSNKNYDVDNKLSKLSIKSLEEIKNEQIPMKLEKYVSTSVIQLEDKNINETNKDSNNLKEKCLKIEAVKCNDIMLELKSDTKRSSPSKWNFAKVSHSLT